MRTKLLSIVAASGIALALGGCSSGAQTSSSSGGGGGTPAAGKFEKKSPMKIGYSVYDLSNPYWESYAAGVKAEAAAEGASVVVADQKGSQQAQVSGSSDLINQGISALIVSPVEPNALPATVTAAHAAKIPVVVGDVGAKGDYDAFILSNNVKGGATAADYMAKQLKSKGGKQKIGIITLHPGSDVGADRVKGFKDQIAKDPNIQIVSELNGNDAIKEGHDAAANMLAAHPDIAGIYAANDNEAQGAVAAIQGAGKSPKDIVVIGFDGSPGAIDAIGKHTQTATVAQDPYGQGRLAVKNAMALLNGKSIQYTDPAAKTVKFPVQLVDASNVADFKAARAAQK
jgi:ribose transport system substrate-binding protein